MAKSTQDKKKKTAAALADTLSAFSEAETEAAEAEAETTAAEVEAEPAAQPETAKPSPKTRSRARTKPSAETTPPGSATTEPRPTERSMLNGLKAGLNRIARRTSPLGADRPVETWREVIEAWLANVTDQGRRRPEWDHLIPLFITHLSAWSPAARQTFYQQWQQHCSQLGFDLNWLVDDALKNSPLKPDLQALALAYIADYQRSQAIRTEMELFKRYLIWREEVAQPKYQALNHTMFIRLTYKGVITAPPPAHIYLASEEAREAYIRQTLLTAADQDTAAFLATLAETGA